MKNLDFYEYLIQRLRTERKNLWKRPVDGKVLSDWHEDNPLPNHNKGVRFGKVRFDSVKGWMLYNMGWHEVPENHKDVVKVILTYNMPYTPEDDNKDFFEVQRAKVLASMEQENLKDERLASEWAKIKDLSPIPSTVENITVMLKYFHRFGIPTSLPAMTVGYSCNAYDCDGKTAVAMKLDDAIPYNEDGDMSNRFVCGAPRGHLVKYHRV